jgi:hypothetical protein
MGILDSKTRIFDTIPTLRGRKTLVNNNFGIEYISYTDAHVVYDHSASDKFYFEAPTYLPQDTIIYDTNNQNRISFTNPTAADISYIDGKAISGSLGGTYKILTGSEFTSRATDLIISQSIGNFKKLRMIGTIDKYLNIDEFTLSTNEITSSITPEKPISVLKDKRDIWEANINHIESLFEDKRLSNTINYRYLPPINKFTAIQDKGLPVGIGNYPRFAQGIYKYEDLMSDLSNRDMNEIKFSQTSRNNNIVGQFYELCNNNVSKLSIIEFGTFNIKDNVTNANINQHIYFAGKIFDDEYGNKTFINIFTLVFET